MQIFMHTRERNEITMVWVIFNAGTDYYNKTNKYVHTCAPTYTGIRMKGVL